VIQVEYLPNQYHLSLSSEKCYALMKKKTYIVYVYIKLVNFDFNSKILLWLRFFLYFVFYVFFFFPKEFLQA